MDDTLLQFGRGPVGAAVTVIPTARARATVCPRCANHFSPDGRFCPFDGEPLLPAPEWDPALDALIGSVVDGRYEVLSVLGEGGMGIVYETRHRALGKRFALKALRKDLASDPEIAARFTQEARTAASVSHPGLVEITDFGKLSSGQPYFVMELLEGQSLASMIRRGGPIPAARAIGIIRQIAEALGAAHERSIIHRDLKPDNIHISPAEGGRDRVTIVDFGLAKVIGASRLTRAGMVFGTPHYMSPEQAMGELTDHRADVYALGVVMYEMFTGRVPFEADSYMGVLTKHMYMAPTPPSQLPGTAQLGALETILLRCLEKKADQRYGTLRELVADLDRVLLGTGKPPVVAARVRGPGLPLLADELELPSHEELSLRGERSFVKRTPWGFVSVIAVLFLAGIGGVLFWRSFPARFGVSSGSRGSVGAAASSGFSLAALARLSPPSLSASPASAQLETPAAAVPSPRSVTASPAPSAGAVTANSVLRKAAPRRATPVTAASRPKASPVGGSEIVDPWARSRK